VAQEQILAQDNASGFSEVKEPESKQAKSGRKNPWQAFGMSLLIPGAGERYAGSQIKSRIFFFAEVSFWVSFLAFRHLSSWKEDDFKLLAQTNAGANLDGKDERFFDVLGFYESREEYNKLGGVYEPTRTYYPDHAFYFWKWDSEESRLRYRELKNQSKNFDRDADFALAFIAANHVLSAVDAFWSAKRFNRRQQSGFWGVDLRYLDSGGLMLTFNTKF
jgi:hypothetical protein